MLDCDATLFINDEKTNELYTEVGEGLDEKSVIKFPIILALLVLFHFRQTSQYSHAYADLRLTQLWQANWVFTRSILCMPVFNKEGKTIGVSQVLNREVAHLMPKMKSNLLPLKFQWELKMQNSSMMFKTRKTIPKASFLACMMQFDHWWKRHY